MQNKNTREKYFIDMDGTLAEWNAVSDEQLYEKNYFRNLKPYDNLLYAVRTMISENKDIYILSSYLTVFMLLMKRMNGLMSIFHKLMRTIVSLFHMVFLKQSILKRKWNLCWIMMTS